MLAPRGLDAPVFGQTRRRATLRQGRHTIDYCIRKVVKAWLQLPLQTASPDCNVQLTLDSPPSSRDGKAVGWKGDKGTRWPCVTSEHKEIRVDFSTFDRTPRHHRRSPALLPWTILHKKVSHIRTLASAAHSQAPSPTIDAGVHRAMRRLSAPRMRHIRRHLRA